MPSAEARSALIRRHLEEILTAEDLEALLASGETLRHYIGFEISGQIHLGTGLACLAKVKDLVDAGVQCTIFLADWHTWINDKLGGDRETIRRVARGYFQEGLKAAFRCVGGDPEALRFVLGTDLYSGNDDYWATVVDVAKNTTLARMQRSITILGRREGESVDFAKLLYPAMQVADIFVLGVHIAHAGLDQRKAHVIARDCALALKHRPLVNARGDKIKPIAIHHPLLLGLGKPPVWPVPPEKRQDVWAAMKMSKSTSASAVFIHDNPDAIRQKVKKAFCPPGEAIFNPILDWTRKLLFREEGASLRIERTPQNGGTVTFSSYADVEKAFLDGSLHPMDLKGGVAERLIEILAPAREAFARPEAARGLATLEAIQSG